MTEPGMARQRQAGPTGQAPGGGVITVGGRVIRLTNVSKVLFDNGITKGELVEYYLAAAEVMVPLIRDRPVVMMRYPDGIDGPRIVQKNVPDYFPDWISRAEVPKRDGGTVRHVVCNDAATLVYLANQASIEPHVFLSRAARPERAQEIVFDLDPPPGPDSARQFSAVRRGALLVRGRPGAPVATPVSWAEVEDSGLTPERFTLRTGTARLAEIRAGSDPWAGFGRRRYGVGAAQRKLATVMAA